MNITFRCACGALFVNAEPKPGRDQVEISTECPNCHRTVTAAIAAAAVQGELLPASQEAA